jgi:hypothetical protein
VVFFFFLRGDQLKVVLYFDKSSADSDATRSDAILGVLSQSALRIAQNESDVITVHNVALKVSSICSFYI